MKFVPSYLKLSKNELREKADRLFEMLKECSICPRLCKVIRTNGQKGFCKVGCYPMVYSYTPHFGEEDILVGRRGSGTIFFTGCNISCVYCQNYEISQLMRGKEVDFETLADMMIELQDLGCHNINFVTPTHQIPQILKSLEVAIEKGLNIPLVYNSSGYDSTEVLKILDGIFDIYMPDIKYSNNTFAEKYSFAPNYFEIAKSAVREMYRQVGDLVVENGIALRGLIVRHLVLPKGIAGSYEVLKFISEEISTNTFINIMKQYRPLFKAYKYNEISRRIYEEELYEVVNIAKEMGFKRIYL
ncbi:MAG: radical SAM protein [Brevinematales bacterium]|nr:radical SAM protein [Brevinematales bacterium]